MSTETITAISTGGTNSGINIIRISGENSFKIIQEIFSNYNKLDHQKIIYGKILKENKYIVDEVLVSYFKAPNSYTGEDICEINCHGGRKVTRDILNLIIETGLARLAEPGEFSKRAFINGKMDLSKAEAVIDIINAKTNIQANVATKQLEGSIKNKIDILKLPLINMIANIEVGIDYPEYEYDELGTEQIHSQIVEVLNGVEDLIDTYNKGRYIKNGINIGIIGSPNSGKSSLLNYLSNSDRAIVTDIAGTTRDVIEEKIILGDLEVNLFDTAGIRKTEDIVENIGINKSIETIDNSDLILLMVDSTKGIEQEDKNIIEMLKQKEKPYIICFNKIDISRENKEEKEEYIYISAKTGKGIDKLEQIISDRFNLIKYNNNEELILINERHKIALGKCRDNLLSAKKQIEEGQTIDLITIDITEALQNINSITGEDVSEEVVNQIFEKFCLGK